MAACGQTGTSTASSATSASASPSPTVDVQANTSEVCASVTKVANADTSAKLGAQFGKMIAARTQHRTADENAAKAQIKSQLADWAKQFRDLAATALDPQLRSALTQTADNVVGLSSDTYLARINTTDDLTTTLSTDLVTAITPISTVCS